MCLGIYICIYMYIYVYERNEQEKEEEKPYVTIPLQWGDQRIHVIKVYNVVKKYLEYTNECFILEASKPIVNKKKEKN
jgi:hypothetical protein